MNVIFLDFDGVLDTQSDPSFYDEESRKELYKKVEKRIAILADICKTYNCKVVIEASAKDAIDEETMEISEDSEWVQFIFSMFKKYGIECIGRTPNVEKRKNKYSSIKMWKEDEIRLYLMKHPEIEHYCILDDDDTKTMLHWDVSDLDKVREHLVMPLDYSDNPEEEGLLPKHKEEVGRVLEKENDVRQLILRRKNR